MSLDISNDHEVFDGLESVTFVVRGASSVSTDIVLTETGNENVQLTQALRRQVTSEMTQRAGGKISVDDVVWEIPAARLTDTGGQPLTPHEGDRILDGDLVTWVVTIVEHATLKNRWRCICKRS